MEIGLLGVPTNSAGRSDGVARAPEALRAAGLASAIRQATTLVDYGDVSLPEPSAGRDPETQVIDPDGLRVLVERVREAVASIVGDGRFPLVIGGDCPVLLGCVGALDADGRAGLLFVDGHEDAYPPNRSTTGEAADMELAFALGMVEAPWWPELPTSPPLVSPEHVRVLGPRDERTLESEGVPSLSDRLSFVDGSRLLATPAEETARAVGSLPSPWWFHLDLDVLSTDALPAVDYRQEGGLGWDELDEVTSVALAAAPVGWDVTIYNPDLDPRRTGADRIVRFIRAALSDAGRPVPTSTR